MLDFTIDPESKERINRALASMDMEESNNVIFKGITDGAVIALQALQGNVAGDILHVRSGNLLRSLGMRVDTQDGAIVGTVGSGAQSESPQVLGEEPGEDDTADPTFRMVYANILETGGTITPKVCQFLAIPIGDALTPSGVARFSAAQLRDGQAPGYEGSVIIGGIIFGTSQTKTRSQITPLFVLKQSVEIPAFEYLSQSLAESQQDVVDALVNAIEKGLNKK